MIIIKNKLIYKKKKKYIKEKRRHKRSQDALISRGYYVQTYLECQQRLERRVDAIWVQKINWQETNNNK